MVQLTQEIKDFVSRGDVGKILATISPDSYPNIGPKGTIQVYDDGSLVYCEFVGKHHYENVKRDPHVAIACIDFAGRQGYRFVGDAEVYESGEVYDKIKAKMPSAANPRAVVLVKVGEVYALGGPQVGERIL
jgi:predicted pyridoxine 5'-phosphate oxidase superfamily flavin-nucleotide-binding protein